MENKEQTMLPVHVFQIPNLDVSIHQFVGRNIDFAVNSYVIETKNALVVIDTQFSKIMGYMFRDYIDGLKKKIEKVIITHAHYDHYKGSENFQDVGVYAIEPIIHDFIQNKVEDINTPKHILDSFSLEGLTYEVLNIRNAHCPNHTIIFIKEIQLIVVGDLCISKGHLLAYNFDNFISALEFMNSKEGYIHLLTGHGKIANFDTLKENIQYMKKCKEIASKVKNKEDFDKEVKATFADYYRIKTNLGVLLHDKNWE